MVMELINGWSDFLRFAIRFFGNDLENDTQ